MGKKKKRREINVSGGRYMYIIIRYPEIHNQRQLEKGTCIIMYYYACCLLNTTTFLEFLIRFLPLSAAAIALSILSFKARGKKRKT